METNPLSSAFRYTRYKIYYGISIQIDITNDTLFRFKPIDSLLCAFCQPEVESPEHLHFPCDVTRSVWQLLFSWIFEQRIISTYCSITLALIARPLQERKQGQFV